MKKVTRIFASLTLAFIAHFSSQLHAGTSVRIGLKASNGQWLSAELTGSRPVVANRNYQGSWETIDVTDLNGGHLAHGDPVGFRSEDGRFICAESGGASNVTANRINLGGWEQFTIERAAGAGAVRPGDAVYFRTQNGNYLRAANGGGGAVDGYGGGHGSWETFTVNFIESPAATNSGVLDVNGDGIPDEVVSRDISRFKSYISSWDTYCYDYTWYPVNDYFWSWDLGFFPDWGYVDDFSSIWIPDPFWDSMSSYSECWTTVNPAVEFWTENGQTYNLYQNNTGESSFNPATWQLLLSSGGFGNSVQTLYLGGEDANSFYQKQYALVKLGKQPASSSLNPALFYNGTMNLSEFVKYAVETLDPPAVDPNVQDDPSQEEYDAVEEMLEQMARERQNREPNDQIPDLALLARRVIVILVVFEIVDQWPLSYCVYRKFDPTYATAYIGRTAGIGDYASVIRRRDQGSDPKRKAMRDAGYKDAEMHSYVTSYGVSIFYYCAMRGREQNVMDNYKFTHNRLSSFNSSRGVKADNPMRFPYHYASNILWNWLYNITGDPVGSHARDILFPILPDKLYYAKDTIQWNPASL